MRSLTPMITGMIGSVVSVLIDFQPLVMGMFMGAIFAVLIVSQVSSVGIAMAIEIEGIALGSANLGITAGAFTLAIMSSKVNGFGTTIAHFLGTPKIQMANILRNPKLFVPVVVSVGIAGLVGAIFNITGTANSAGFGSAGLIGPLAYGEWSDYDCVLGSDFCGDATAAWLPHALHFYSKIGLC